MPLFADVDVTVSGFEYLLSSIAEPIYELADSDAEMVTKDL